MEVKLTKDRLITVDALRGFALLGIMLAHFIYWYSAGPLTESVYKMHTGVGSEVADVINNLLVSGKFFAFFSFLFGLSFYLQMHGIKPDQKTFIRRYSWRLILLFIIGLIHHTFWQGDILTIYAPLGFVLLMLRGLSDKWVSILGIALALNLPGKVIAIFQILDSSPQAMQGDYAAIANGYHQLLSHGNLLDLFSYHWHHWSDKVNFQVDSGRIFITMGFFLLGMYVGRMRWLENADSSKNIVRKICRRSAVIMAIALVSGISMMLADNFFILGWQQNQVAGNVFMIFYDVFNSALVVLLISGVTLLIYTNKGKLVFYPMASVGKMALTSYITQTAFGLILFYSFGFGLYTKTTPGFNYLLAIAFFLIQVQFSKWWLTYFNFGPLEWLWRSGTLLKWQPMLKPRKAPAPVSVLVTPAVTEAVLTN